MASDDEDHFDDGGDDAWNEMDTCNGGPVTCLFCDKLYCSPSEVFKHCSDEHNFKIKEACKSWDLDCIGYIMMINYIRAMHPAASVCCPRVAGHSPPWSDEKYMQPVDPEDALLQYDIESLDIDADDSETVGGAGDTGHDITVPQETYRALCQRLAAAESNSRIMEEKYSLLLQDLETMRKSARDLVLSEPQSTSWSYHPAPTESEDEAYFSSYSHYGIHEQMLKDTVRTESYRDFMYQNPEVFRDKTVLDVGCGTGILAMFAAKAGAKHVYGVDQSEIIYQAMDIIRENNLSDKITLKKGRLEDVTLPVEKVDVIISEWMGYFLLFESMLDTVLLARDTYLADGGIVYPDICSLYLLASSDASLYDKHVKFWDDVYGFNMSCIKNQVVTEARVEVADKDCIASEPVLLKTFDLSSCTVADLQFESSFTLKISQAGTVNALVGYFDINFDKNCTNKVTFSTSPLAKDTHWMQSIFFLPNPVSVTEGDVLTGTLSCKRNRADPRSLRIQIQLEDKVYSYMMQ